ncbi:enoyl-CoA hydratase-related protein [Hoeflea prorocentri]|uniref:Enoyl-CoA hydratase-related protein n=1 Tax=Hoeflea prorocentri TaxID=1922333 RepID=A0A9X3UGQ3_9HYPH|nr:enoyl-CoA hydratase-related protein [Hoeflea prorocentri]MCY6380392.1 enoyl-CoA hydratase-related protein [Hoeflea prorocentri]MDA5398192.1 enoyl-CoA hydratase-related protein [Hoeflea prorocentri]
MKSRHTFAAETLIASTDGTAGFLTLNRPERKNAITFDMWRTIPQALEWLCAQGDIRCVILEGEGGMDFSAGADITEFDQLREERSAAEDYEKSNADGFRAVRHCPVPVIAMINGVCFGGAFGLAAAADMRIASNDAIFAVPAGRLGLAYPVDAMSDIVEAVGPQTARALLYTGRRFNARQAHSAGLLLSVCGLADLKAVTMDLVEQICTNAPLSNRASKASIRAVLSGSTDDRTLAENIAQSTFASLDYQEGRKAFQEKRPPVFSGK